MIVEGNRQRGRWGTAVASAGGIVSGANVTPGFKVGGFLRLEIGKRRNGLGAETVVMQKTPTSEM
jgi:hypothetical protein